MSETAVKYRPKFKADKKRARNIDFTRTPYYDESLVLIWRHGYMQTSQLARGLGRSTKKTSETMRKLLDTGFIRAIEVKAHMWEGSHERVHCLTTKGAKRIKERYGYDLPVTKWSERSGKKTENNLNHALAETDIRLAIQLAVEANDDLELLWRDDLLKLAPRKTQESRYPLNLKTSIRDDENKLMPVTKVPDDILAIRDTTRPAGENTIYLLIEADMQTETIAPRKIKRHETSIRKSLMAYKALEREGVIKEQLNLPYFRVLFVTKTETRVKNMVECLQEHTGDAAGNKIFMFTTREQVVKSQNLIDERIWLKSNGQRWPLYARKR